MSTHLLQLQVQAHAANLGEQGRQARLARLVRTRRPRRRRLRRWAARLLAALAMRLDDRLRPPAVQGPASH